MATPTPTETQLEPSLLSNGTLVEQWALGDADTGVAITMPNYGNRTVQVEGTFGGATIVLEGSVDGTNYKTLTDQSGNALSFTSAGLKSVQQTPPYTRAKSTGGTGAAVVVSLHLRRQNRPS